jgi:hypothetical protein
MQKYDTPTRSWQGRTFEQVFVYAPKVVITPYQFLVATDGVRSSLLRFHSPREHVNITARRLDEGDIPLLLGLIAERPEEMTSFVELIRPSFDPLGQYDIDTTEATLLALLSPHLPYGLDQATHTTSRFVVESGGTHPAGRRVMLIGE